MAEGAKRLIYFDVIKGMAIFMVVMGHVLTMCIRGIDNAPLFKFIGEIHMPLFFFVSGWFTFRLRPDGTLKRPGIGSRATRLLIPMVVVSSLWIWYFPHSGLESPIESTFKGLWLNVWKNGYWFTLCLFELILVYAALTPLYGKARKPGVTSLLSLGVWAVLIGIYRLLQGSDVAAFLGLELVATYWPAFIFGYIASRFRNIFDKAITRPLPTAFALIAGSLTMYYICWWWEFPGKELFAANESNLVLARPLLHVCLAIVAFAVFKPAVERATADGREPRWVRCWSYIGVNSLGIYLLHYFFLFPAGGIRDFLISLNLGFVPLFFAAAVCAAMIVCVTLGVMKVIAINGPLNFLLTGTVMSKK